jgi:hypothetical protein
MIFREDCGYVYVGPNHDPFVLAARRLCGESPLDSFDMFDMYRYRVDPKTVAREELKHFIDSLGGSRTGRMSCSRPNFSTLPQNG